MRSNGLGLSYLDERRGRGKVERGIDDDGEKMNARGIRNVYITFASVVD